MPSSVWVFLGVFVLSDLPQRDALAWVMNRILECPSAISDSFSSASRADAFSMWNARFSLLKLDYEAFWLKKCSSGSTNPDGFVRSFSGWIVHKSWINKAAKHMRGRESLTPSQFFCSTLDRFSLSSRKFNFFPGPTIPHPPTRLHKKHFRSIPNDKNIFISICCCFHLQS